MPHPEQTRRGGQKEKIMKKLLVLSVLALTMVFALSSEAKADDTPCVGILTGTFDNVVVPPGATCILIDSTVRGNVKALEDSRLFMFNDTVRGNVDGDKASSVNVNRCTVGGNIQIQEAHDPDLISAAVFNSILTGGNIQIEKGRFPFGDWIVVQTILRRGNVKVEENGTIFDSLVVDSTVRQNVQVFKNFGPGPKFVQRNIVGQDLQCKENQDPFIGGPNTARKAEGQCF
jgi:hypothetical protein